MKALGLAVGVLALVAILVAPPPDGLSLAGWRVAAMLACMIVWWLTEAAPLAVTALLPMILLPLLDVSPADKVARSYAAPLLGLVFGGAMIAIAASKVGLHRRVAQLAVRLGGGGPRRLLLALMVATALLGMWMATSVVTILMLEIGLALAAAATGWRADDAEAPPEARDFSRAAILGVAYAAAFGGLASLLGSPVNAAAVGVIARQTGERLDFAGWLAFGLPLAVVGVVASWALLLAIFRRRIVLPERGALMAALDGGMAGGPAEMRVLVVALATLASLAFLPLLKPFVPGLSDAGVALTGALALFLLPSGEARGARLLSWEDTRAAPWGVLVVIGGALALSTALTDTGLAAWLAEPLRGLAGAPPWLALLALVAGVAVLTEFVNNFAAMAIAVPAAAALAKALDVDPAPFAVAVTLAAGGGFIVPGPPWLTLAVVTPPVRFADLVRSGVWLLALAPPLITAVCLAVGTLR